MTVFKASHRFTALLLSVLMLFTLSPAVYATTEQYPEYEFVVTSDKESVSAGDVLTLTVTANGPMNNASAMEIHVEYTNADFSSTGVPRTAFETEWYNYVRGGDGLGYLSKPSCGVTPVESDATKSVIKAMFASTDGTYIDDYSDLYDKETTVAAKMVFTALKDVADVSECFELTVAKHTYGDDSGTIKECSNTTKVQLEPIEEEEPTDEPADPYPAYEFVVTSDKESVSAGDVLTLTITANGPMNNASAMEIHVEYTNADFSSTGVPRTAFETEWYNYVRGGDGLGYLSKPSCGVTPVESDATKSVIKAMFASTDGTYIDDYSDLYNKETTVAAKMVFTALKDVADVSKCFELTVAKHTYGDDSGTVKECSDTTKVQLVPTTPDVPDVPVVPAEVTAVIAKIDAIGTPVTYASKAAIEDARAAYDALTTDELKNQVTNYSALTAAEQALNALQTQIDNVVELIDAIGTVTINSADKISAARAAYDALATDELKNQVANYSVLTAAEQALNAINTKIDNVVALIDAIGTVTLDSADAIAAAREAYDALTADEKATIADSEQKLIKAENDLAALQQNAADLAEAKKVDALIDAIGAVTLDSGDAIDAAKAAFAALTPAQQALVENYAVLTKAAADYSELCAAADDAHKVEELIALIPAAITKDNLAEAKTKVADAEAELALLSEKATELLAQASLEALNTAKAQIATVESDIKAAADVDALINALGTITIDSAAKIEEAEAAYAALSAVAQTYVTLKAELDAARDAYDALVAEQEAIDNVIAIIAALGTVDDVTLDSINAIEEAEAALNALDETLRGRVTNAQTLADIRVRYNELLASKNKVDNVIALIDGIGEVTLNSAAEISAARAAYEALSNEEKEQVTNYADLESAEAAYEEIKDAADQEVIDRAAAAGVDNLIANIGEVTLTDECNTAINAAMDAYAALTDVQKGYVAKYDDLVNAKAEYDALARDKAAVDAVIAAINAIGTVEYTTESLEKIDNAENLYNALDDMLKANVTNASVIGQARQQYAALKADAEAVAAVEEFIAAIGDIEYSDECLAKLNAAQAAYDALRDDLKAKVENYEDLQNAWTAYRDSEPKVDKVEEVEGYQGQHIIVVNNVGEGKVVSFGNVQADLVKIGTEIFHVIVTTETISEADLVIEDGTPAEQALGNVMDDSGEIDATDALAANVAVTNPETFADDPMKFVRADVDGSGAITARDALMIARMALDPASMEQYLKLHTMR